MIPVESPLPARRLSDPFVCSRCDRHPPGAPVAQYERPRHYAARQRGSDAAGIGVQVRNVPAVFPDPSECCADDDVIEINHADR